MKRRNIKTRKKDAKFMVLLCLVAYSFFFFSCRFNEYETGDGKYSYLRADFVEAHTLSTQQVDYAINDDGERIEFSTPFTVKWAEKEDTLYRALLYYNRKPEGAEPINIQYVYVLWPKDVDSIQSPKTDPVVWESGWISQCQRSLLYEGQSISRYLNVSFSVKTGQHEDELKQSIGVMSRNGNDTLFFTLLHDQGGVPEYYSSHVYASIPLFSSNEDGAENKLSSVIFSVNTYQGMVMKSY